MNAAFLSSLSSRHEFWIGIDRRFSSASFEDAFCGYLAMMTDLDSLQSLGVEGIDTTSPYANCPICAHAPEGRQSDLSYGFMHR